MRGASQSCIERGRNPPIYDKTIFPWARSIESEWPTIRAELQRVLSRKEELPAFHELAADASVVSNDRRWKSFVLTGYGFRSYNNIRLCPETWRICQNIPGLITAPFSILDPGKHLPAHRGPYNGVLRLHLGLIVPEPRERLGIRVENQIYRWREGEVVIFDTGKICKKALNDKAFGFDQDFLGTPGVRSPINPLPVTGSW